MNRPHFGFCLPVCYEAALQKKTLASGGCRCSFFFAQPAKKKQKSWRERRQPLARDCECTHVPANAQLYFMPVYASSVSHHATCGMSDSSNKGFIDTDVAYAAARPYVRSRTTATNDSVLDDVNTRINSCRPVIHDRHKSQVVSDAVRECGLRCLGVRHRWLHSVSRCLARGGRT